MICLPKGKRKDVILKDKIKYKKESVKYIKCVNVLCILILHAMKIESFESYLMTRVIRMVSFLFCRDILFSTASTEK